MMRLKGKIFLSSLFLGLMLANFASAQLVNCGGYDATGADLPPCTIPLLIQTIQLIINTLLSWAWLVAILFIVISGFRMVFSRGDTEAISQAKTSLKHAVMGFILILISFVILNLVVGLLTGGSGSLTDAFQLLPQQRK